MKRPWRESWPAALAGLALASQPLAAANGPWVDGAGEFRIAVTVQADGHARFEKPVEIRLECGTVPAVADAMEVIEVDARGTAVERAVPFQFDRNGEGGCRGNLVFVLTGRTAPDQQRLFHVYFGGNRGELPFPRQVRVDADGVDYQGQKSFRVSTVSGTYLYHKAGAGFASWFDKDGNDWIGYRPSGGSDGRYRGIPNLIHPAGQFHPGGENSVSRIVTQGPLKCVIASETSDGGYAGTWEIYPRYARFTVLKAAAPYWFLYEGTPGGRLDVQADYWVRSGGERLPVSESWQGRLNAPRWVYFGDSRMSRILYLVHEEDDGEYDQFYQMQENMTVFGFGRKYRCCDKSLTGAPARFVIGMEDAAGFDEAKSIIEGAYRPVKVSAGPVERR